MEPETATGRLILARRCGGCPDGKPISTRRPTTVARVAVHSPDTNYCQLPPDAAVIIRIIHGAWDVDALAQRMVSYEGTGRRDIFWYVAAHATIVTGKDRAGERFYHPMIYKFDVAEASPHEI
jgi:hypothetical protein